MAKITIKEEWVEGIKTLPVNIQAEALGAITFFLVSGELPSVSEKTKMALAILMPSVALFADKSQKMKENGAKAKHTESLQFAEDLLKQNASKCEANAEQNESKAEAKAEQTVSEETPLAPPPVPPTTTPIEVTGDKTPNKENPSKEGQKKVPLPIEERKKAFGESLAKYVGSEKGQYPRPMVARFFKWWSEYGENDRKMRFEKEKTWSTKSRLETWWDRHHNEYNTNDNGNRFRQDYDSGSEEHRERSYESTIQI